MNNEYLIPGRDDTFLEWAKDFYAYALAHYGNWRIPSPQLTLEAPLAAFEAAYAKCQSPNRGKVDVREKNKARETLKKAYFDYCEANFRDNPQVTDADRKSMMRFAIRYSRFYFEHFSGNVPLNMLINVLINVLLFAIAFGIVGGLYFLLFTLKK
jgi:hypothetical protein